MLILNINDRDIQSIKSGNNSLLKTKLKEEANKWRNRVLLGKEDHRFNQGVYCTLLDFLNLMES